MKIVSKYLKRIISRSNVVIDSELNQLFYEFRQAKANEKEHNGQKIILVRPPFIHLEAGPPIGLAYLQDILAKQGHKVLVWDINLSLVNFKGLDQYNRDFVIPDNHPAVSYAEKNIAQYCNQILELQPDVVGISLSYSTEKFGLEIAKRLSGKVRCIAGGPQASFNESKLFDTGYFDAVVSGYGEEGILDALSKNGIIQKNLDKSKEYHPNYKGIEINKYNGRLPIVSTRGCPNNCSFCTQNHPYYYHSIESVVNQIRNTPNIREVMFNDSNINVNPKRTEKLFDALSKIPTKYRAHIFGAQIRDGFERYVEKMANSGVQEVRLGIESGSPRERASMNKPKFSNELVVDFVKELTAHKIVTWTQFIFCYPDQTETDRSETVDLMKELNAKCDPSYVKHFWYKFVVHHGTEKDFKERYGVISNSPQNWHNSNYNPSIVEKTAKIYRGKIPTNAKIFL